MNFTTEEMTLMMLYSPGTRPGLVAELQAMRGALGKSERRLRALTDSTLEKLGRITDAEFDSLPLYPAFDP